MTEKGKYYSLLLLAGFLVPQVANGMHYFLLPHASYSQDTSSYSFTKPGIYEYHYCDYHLTGTDFALADEDQPQEDKIPEFDIRVNGLDFVIYLTRFYYNYTLRGPPLSP